MQPTIDAILDTAVAAGLWGLGHIEANGISAIMIAFAVSVLVITFALGRFRRRWPPTTKRRSAFSRWINRAK